MALIGPIACPDCRFEVSIAERRPWRIAGGGGQYMCPRCRHIFLGRDFVDLGTLEEGERISFRAWCDKMAQLEQRLAEGSEPEQIIRDTFGMTEADIERLIDSLRYIYPKHSNKWRERASLMMAETRKEPPIKFLEAVAWDPPVVKQQWPHVWQNYRERGGKDVADPFDHLSEDDRKIFNILTQDTRVLGCVFVEEQPAQAETALRAFILHTRQLVDVSGPPSSRAGTALARMMSWLQRFGRVHIISFPSSSFSILEHSPAPNTWWLIHDVIDDYDFKYYAYIDAREGEKYWDRRVKEERQVPDGFRIHFASLGARKSLHPQFADRAQGRVIALE